MAGAGANAGGTLILHANPSINYTTEVKSYGGHAGITDCAKAVDSVPANPSRTTVFYVLAAFAPESSPRLRGLTFGIRYDPKRFGLVGRGSSGDSEIPGAHWPNSGSGNAVAWKTAQTAGLLEAYWFAGYAYSKQDTTSFTLTAHPDPELGGAFADDAVPAQLDPITAYGRLGFGTAGLAPCPQPAKKGQEAPAK